jgi:long-chain acyl-CoA synthetase
MTEAGLVDSPLAEWARARPQASALGNGKSSLSFAELDALVAQRASLLAQVDAPATVKVDGPATTLERLVEFLAVLRSGRCAAVIDTDWPAPLRESVDTLIGALPRELTPNSPEAPFYIGFTSGSTGRPKGFRRNHRSWVESFRACLDTFGPDVAAGILAPGSITHSLFLFGMLLGIWSGGGVVVQERFSAARALATLRLGRTPCLIAVPSQLLLMIALAARRRIEPVEEVRLILISGARWARNRTSELQAVFPNARIIEFYGASETSFVAWMRADADSPPEVVGRPFPGVEIDVRGDGAEPGLIFVRSSMLFTDYIGTADSTAAIRDGEWLSIRDMGHVDAQGRLCLVGRQHRMIVTQGKNLFPEEVEAVLMSHPEIVHASVHGMADPLRGMQVVAVLQIAPQAATFQAQKMMDWCRAQLEAYKTPKRYFTCAHWPLTAGGKTDHVALSQALLRLPQEACATTNLPCLQALS